MKRYDPLDAHLDNLALDADKLRKQLFTMKQAVATFLSNQNDQYRRDIEFLRDSYGDELFRHLLPSEEKPQ